MRIGLVGVGHWHAGMHADAAIACGGEISAVWDEDRAIASAFASARGLRDVDTPKAVFDAAELAIVMGRPDRLAPLVQMGLASGVPLVLEKPVAPDTAALARLVDRAGAVGGFVSVPLANRFGPAMIECKRLAAAGRLGQLAHAHFRIVNGPPERYRRDGVGWMCDPAIGGGGALRNLGIHGIDAALSLAVGPLRLACAAVGKRIFHAEAIEDHAVVVLLDSGGATFTIEAGYTYPWMRAGGDTEWRIVSANAYIVDRGTEALVATRDDGSRHALSQTGSGERYRLFLSDVMARLRAGEAPQVSLADYLSAMELIDRAYERAQP